MPKLGTGGNAMADEMGAVLDCMVEVPGAVAPIPPLARPCKVAPVWPPPGRVPPGQCGYATAPIRGVGHSPHWALSAVTPADVHSQHAMRSGGTALGVSSGQAQRLPIGQSLSQAKSGVRHSWLPTSITNLPRVRKMLRQTILSKRLSWVFGMMPLYQSQTSRLSLFRQP